MKHFKNVFANRPIDDDLKEHKEDWEELARLWMVECSENKTPDWTLE